MEYKTSQTELTRRKKAYMTLCTSILIGLVLSSFIFSFPISLGGYASVIGILLLLGAFSFRFFHTISQIKIILSHQSLCRVVNRVSEEYMLNNINRITIKWTTHKTIREIYIWLDDGKSIFITALDHFEKFRKDLLDTLDTNVVVREIHEPLDFDHPLFYSLLGLPISVTGVLLFTLIPFLSYQQIKIGGIVFSLFLFMFGLYFISTKPLSKRSGNKAVVSDYIMGFLMIFLGAIILSLWLMF